MPLLIPCSHYTLLLCGAVGAILSPVSMSFSLLSAQAYKSILPNHSLSWTHHRKFCVATVWIVAALSPFCSVFVLYVHSLHVGIIVSPNSFGLSFMWKEPFKHFISHSVIETMVWCQALSAVCGALYTPLCLLIHVFITQLTEEKAGRKAFITWLSELVTWWWMCALLPPI